MLICAAGDIHGAMDGLYQDVFAFEASLRVRFDYVLHVGDFGIWPDPSRIDKATRHHEGVGDFPAWLKENRRAPRPTVFIKGNHEDFVWLDAQHGHHHTRVDAEVSGVRCIGLNKVAMPGNLVAIDMEPGKRDWSLVGEYPQMRARDSKEGS